MKQLLTVMFGMAAVSYFAPSAEAGIQPGVNASTASLVQSTIAFDADSGEIQLAGHCGRGGGYGRSYYRGGGGYGGGYGYQRSSFRSPYSFGGGYGGYGRYPGRGYGRSYGRGGGVSLFIGF